MTTEILENVEEESTESVRHRKAPRAELVAALVERDGTKCMFPGCGAELDFSITDGPKEVTLDHWIPQWYGKDHGWTWDEIWSVDNLKLMEKKCNAKKGERVPNADGTLPERITKQFKYRRQKRANRPDGPCEVCNNGHDLFVGEICAQCGCDAQRFPISAKVRYNECDHEILWCWVCCITPEMRPAAAETAVLQGESGEWE